MNIPIRDILDEEKTLKRTLKFEFEIGHFDERDKRCKLNKIEVICDSEDDQHRDHES